MEFSQVPNPVHSFNYFAFDNGLSAVYFGKMRHANAIILLIISGGILFGLFGMLLAIPVATVHKPSQRIYLRKSLRLQECNK
jgi:hypothetical protein